MVKLLSTISLILALVLFPPAALALVSNNAVPGDVTYPIKRSLEDIIFAIASINPTARAWFAKARSDRRFKEVEVLITQGKQAGNTLNELVEQTQVAASQIAQVTDQAQRTELIEQLSGSIEKYDQGLKQFTPIPEATPLPQATSSPQSTTFPQVIIQPTPTPLPTASPTPGPDRQEEEKEKQRQREIREARRKLEEIRGRLQEQEKDHKERESKKEKRTGRDDQNTKESRF